MLNSTTLKPGGKGAADYLAHAEYHLDAAETQMTWEGIGAKLLGLHGKEVDLATLKRICANRDELGFKIAKSRGQKRDQGRVYTFTTPKSVGLMAGMWDDRIYDAHKQAVDATMRLIQETTETRVRKDGADYNRRTGNLLFARTLETLTRTIASTACPGKPHPLRIRNPLYPRNNFPLALTPSFALWCSA